MCSHHQYLVPNIIFVASEGALPSVTPHFPPSPSLSTDLPILDTRSEWNPTCMCGLLWLASWHNVPELHPRYIMPITTSRLHRMDLPRHVYSLTDIWAVRLLTTVNRAAVNHPCTRFRLKALDFLLLSPVDKAVRHNCIHSKCLLSLCVFSSS